MYQAGNSGNSSKSTTILLIQIKDSSSKVNRSRCRYWSHFIGQWSRNAKWSVPSGCRTGLSERQHTAGQHPTLMLVTGLSAQSQHTAGQHPTLVLRTRLSTQRQVMAGILIHPCNHLSESSSCSRNINPTYFRSKFPEKSNLPLSGSCRFQGM